MSLNNLFSKLKGGSGSGNKGHAGIPGHRGGSAPSLLHGPDVTYAQFVREISKKDVDKGEIVAGFYNNRTGELILPKGSATTHDSLAEKMGGKGVIDVNTHVSFVFNSSFYQLEKVIFNTQQAGHFMGRYSGNHRDKALKNIYKAMDKLIARGFPKGTKVEIYDPKVTTIKTSL